MTHAIYVPDDDAEDSDINIFYCLVVFFSLFLIFIWSLSCCLSKRKHRKLHKRRLVEDYDDEYDEVEVYKDYRYVVKAPPPAVERPYDHPTYMMDHGQQSSPYYQVVAVRE